MKINYNSWFVRNYLYYGEYNTLPKTICELGRAFIGMTIIWILLATVIAMFGSLYLTGLFGMFYVLITDATMQSFFNTGAKEPTWAFNGLMVFYVVNVIAAIFGSLCLFGWFKNYRTNKRFERLKKHGILVEDKPFPVTEFVKGIWGRIHDKTCTLLQWENDPKTRRELEYEAQRSEWEAKEAARIKEAAGIMEEENKA